VFGSNPPGPAGGVSKVRSGETRTLFGNGIQTANLRRYSGQVKDYYDSDPEKASLFIKTIIRMFYKLVKNFRKIWARMIVFFQECELEEDMCSKQ
jgi:hypothetical protein